MSILRNRVLRTEDPAFLDDGRHPSTTSSCRASLAHVVYVRSTMASARLLEVDTSEAPAMPGVLAVLTVDDPRSPTSPVDVPPEPGSCGLLARDVVRYVGEPIAAVVAETGPRPPTPPSSSSSTTTRSRRSSTPRPRRPPTAPFPAAESQIVMAMDDSGMSADFSGCEVVVEQRIINQRMAPCPIEPRSAAAHWDDDGRPGRALQQPGAHPIREGVAKVLGLEESQVRVITPDVGGSFGSKSSPYPEDLLLGPIASASADP